MQTERELDKIEELTIGEVVYVKSKNDKGPVTRIHPPTITVALLGGTIEVREGDFEKRS